MKKAGSEKTLESKGILNWRTNPCTTSTNLAYTTNLLAYIFILCSRFNAPWAFGVTLSITSHYLMTKDFTDTPNKGKINNNIWCFFGKFDILNKVFTYAISFSLITKDGHKTKLTLSKKMATPFI